MARKSGNRRPDVWSGAVVEEAHAWLVATTRWPATCEVCGRPVQRDERWFVGHRKSRAAYPELTHSPTNWRPEHPSCSSGGGTAAAVEKRLRELGVEEDGEGGVRPVSSPAGPPAGAAALRFPPTEPEDPGPGRVPGLTGDDLGLPGHLTWENLLRSAPEWFREEFGEPPPDAAPPLLVTAWHPRAAGTYGPDAVAFSVDKLGITPRWWQKLALYLILQHGADGQLLFEEDVVSASRRAGKSELSVILSAWRLERGEDLFGERQELILTANNHGVARKIHAGAHERARKLGWKVYQGSGSEAINNGENTWVVKAVTAVNGWSPGMVQVDEAWDVLGNVVDNNIEPALLERQSPLLLFTSSSHPRATSTVKTRIADALAAEQEGVLVLVWAAAPGSDPGSPATWRAASAHWTDKRERLMARLYAKALRGEADPEFDNLDPMEGFLTQYLNVWSLRDRGRRKGAAAIEEDDWAELQREAPERPPTAVAIEGQHGSGVSVALAWRGGPVRVLPARTASEAAEIVRASGYRGQVRAGASFLKDPGLAGLRLLPVSDQVLTSVKDLDRLLEEGAITHDGGARLTRQVLALRTARSPGGQVRVVSTEPTDAIKSAIWAVKAARGSGRRIQVRTGSASATPA
ncbi:MAG: HNH endonuclease [Streptomyces sp.]|nr:HNH endonuclease [Streptomyces sp.]